MTPFDLLESTHPVAEARPLVAGFLRSAFCPREDVAAARPALDVLLLFLAMTTERGPDGLAFEALNPDLLLVTSLESHPTEVAFLDELLRVSSRFYEFLAASAVVSSPVALGIAGRLRFLASGMRAAA